MQDITYPSPKNGKLLLPASFKKKNMYEEYLKEPGDKVCLRQFKNYYKERYGHLKKQSVYTDYCDKCSMF